MELTRETTTELEQIVLPSGSGNEETFYANYYNLGNGGRWKKQLPSSDSQFEENSNQSMLFV